MKHTLGHSRWHYAALWITRLLQHNMSSAPSHCGETETSERETDTGEGEEGVPGKTGWRTDSSVSVWGVMAAAVRRSESTLVENVSMFPRRPVWTPPVRDTGDLSAAEEQIHVSLWRPQRHEGVWVIFVLHSFSWSWNQTSSSFCCRLTSVWWFHLDGPAGEKGCYI